MYKKGKLKKNDEKFIKEDNKQENDNEINKCCK